jgi:hypothetical protein
MEKLMEGQIRNRNLIQDKERKEEVFKAKK